MDNVIIDQKILRQVSRLTTMEEVTELDLIERLKAACNNAWTPGCGLAAIQIGIPLRFAWYMWGEQEFTLLNPEITQYRGEIKWKSEGCLSIPHNHVNVKRAYKIKYINDGQLFTAKRDKAHIIQHEVDHMNGVLNIDKKR